MPNTSLAVTPYNKLKNASPAKPRGVPFASFEAQSNGDVLVVGDPHALFAYIKPMAEYPRQVARGVMLKKREADLIAYIPLRLETLASGMVWSPSHGDTAFTVPLFDEFMHRIMPGNDWDTM